MCGRIIIKKSLQVVQEELNLKPQPEVFEFRSYNLGPGSMAPVLMPDKQFSMLRFGLTPHWSSKPMLLFNARSEGDHNKENDPAYSGAPGILQKPSFRMPIRKQRCLVFVNGFLEGPEKEKLSKPFYVFDQDRDFIALAGIYDSWINKDTGEEVPGFAIITAAANPVTRAIGHHRSPVCIPESHYSLWLHGQRLDDISPLLVPDTRTRFNAYPISPEIRNPRSNDPALLDPVGPALFTQTSVRFTTEFDTQGFGRKKKL